MLHFMCVRYVIGRVCRFWAIPIRIHGNSELGGWQLIFFFFRFLLEIKSLDGVTDTCNDADVIFMATITGRTFW